jgi:hypothetical protein
MAVWRWDLDITLSRALPSSGEHTLLRFPMASDRASSGWESDFPTFRAAEPRVVREQLASYIVDASPEQQRAWAEAIPPLQREVDEVLARDILAAHYSAILEYELPMESRRPDVLLLVGAGVLVVELKGKLVPSQADLDQVAAYARDLRNYHRECAGRPVVPVLVPTRARGYQQEIDGIHVTGPDALDTVVARLAAEARGTPIARDRFLDASAYQPLPSLIEAARELFNTGELRTIRRAHAATEPAVQEISRIIHQAALTKSRHLILLTGSPGAGKTLVGLRTVHAKYLDDLAVARNGEKEIPAVFLSGNMPLVQVLQWELRSAGGEGKTFVRHVKDYVRRYSSTRSPTPPEHILVFDEAQRAFDAAATDIQHDTNEGKSEPDRFIEFADRIPEWCVVLGLIGGGQEIHVGEEGGVGQWLHAVEASAKRDEWMIHAPPGIAPQVRGGRLEPEVRPTLHLDTELRFHSVNVLHRFVAGLLEGGDVGHLRETAAQLESEGLHLRITRALDRAKQHLRERYAGEGDKRFGLMASSRDRDLTHFGVPNDWNSTRRMRFGPWFGGNESTPQTEHCRGLVSCVTEFGAQGLELDGVLLAWGTDFARRHGSWSIARSRPYKRDSQIKDAFQLRVNAYRVLLTRGRDGTVVFLPPLDELNETYEYLVAAGFRELAS